MSQPFPAGACVRVVGLVKAAQHNGKIGRVTAAAAQAGRVGVDLGNSQPPLAVRPANLELLPSSSKSDELPVQRTLTRDNSLLNEFDASEDNNLLVLYHHKRDRAFDWHADERLEPSTSLASSASPTFQPPRRRSYNASEYHAQMHTYYDNAIVVTAVVPRRIRQSDYLLVCLRHEVDERNDLCELAFQCMRQFAGYCVLVKRRCFVCHKPRAYVCTCQCACFCSKDCEAAGRGAHAKLCARIRSSPVVTEDEVVQLV